MIKYRTADATTAAEAFTEDTIQELRGNLSSCVALGDERVSLALQTYELVRKNLLLQFHLKIGLKRVIQSQELYIQQISK